MNGPTCTEPIFDLFGRHVSWGDIVEICMFTMFERVPLNPTVFDRFVPGECAAS